MIQGEKIGGISEKIYEEYWVQVSDPDSLQVQSYTCWKLGFVTNP
jgi:hypothetical protein